MMVRFLLIVTFCALVLPGISASAGETSATNENLPPVISSQCTAAESAEAGKALNAACCKTCRKGKACGNSCISRSKTCHQPPGCACDGARPESEDDDFTL